LAWLKRFGLHLAAAVGATGIFVAAVSVGASQTRQREASAGPTAVIAVLPRAPGARPKPSVVVAPTPTPARTTPAAPPAPTEQVVPERSLSGTIMEVLPDGLDVTGVGGREWHIVAAPGALIRLNGKAAHLDGLQAGDSVVILGQAQPGPGARFLAHAITARRK
jgi:hypothetical protein